MDLGAGDAEALILRLWLERKVVPVKDWGHIFTRILRDILRPSGPSSRVPGSSGVGTTSLDGDSLGELHYHIVHVDIFCSNRKYCVQDF